MHCAVCDLGSMVLVGGRQHVPSGAASVRHASLYRLLTYTLAHFVFHFDNTEAEPDLVLERVVKEACYKTVVSALVVL